ncbi:MAG TPA: hypothetical protein VM934_03380 [Pyrinomonadaceae bacterium]|nr:hypothetical protein [Pyrinomonadaceae bacterium]
MAVSTNARKSGARFRAHGYVGLFVMLAAEAFLFSGNRVVGEWFTPIVWTGYVLLADALVAKVKGRSLLTTDRDELLVIVAVSVGAWWLFEFYNAPRFWKSDLELWWHYHNLVPNPYLRRVGYDWAFATIFPALFLTAELFAATVFRKWRHGLTLKFSKPTLYLFIFAGALGALVPLFLVSKWLVPVVWLSYVFLLDPVNALRGRPSIVGDLARGDWQRLAGLLASGAVCGVLWEFWNFWATAKWTYTVPYLGDVKIFEMPVLGYLGFPPFVVECWAIYVFCRSLLRPVRRMAPKEEALIWASPERGG